MWMRGHTRMFPQDIIQLGMPRCHPCAQQPVWALRGLRPQAADNRACDKHPRSHTSRAKGAGVLRGNSDDFLQEEVFVLNSEG